MDQSTGDQKDFVERGLQAVELEGRTEGSWVIEGYVQSSKMGRKSCVTTSAMPWNVNSRFAT